MYLNLIRIEYIRFIGLKKYPTEPKRNELNRKTGIKYHTIRHKPAWVQSASPIKVIHSETLRHPGPWRWPRTSRNQAVVAAVKGSSRVGFSGWIRLQNMILATNSGCLPKHGKIASNCPGLTPSFFEVANIPAGSLHPQFCWCCRNTLWSWKSPRRKSALGAPYERLAPGDAKRSPVAMAKESPQLPSCMWSPPSRVTGVTGETAFL